MRNDNDLLSRPPTDQVQKYDVRVDRDVVPLDVVRERPQREEGQLQGARRRGPIRDTHWRMGNYITNLVDDRGTAVYQDPK